MLVVEAESVDRSRAAAGNQTVDLIRDAGGEAFFVNADVAQAADAETMIATAVDVYGRLDVLFNNAGIEGPLATWRAKPGQGSPRRPAVAQVRQERWPPRGKVLSAR